MTTRLDQLRRLARWALAVGVAGVAGAAAVGAFRPQAFFFGWLFAFVLWFGAPLGCAAILMTHHLVGGRWGWSVRRPTEAAMRTFPVVAVLFVPLLFGLRQLYSWARPAAVAASKELTFKAPYLNEPFFIIRAVVFFALWIVGGIVLFRWSTDQRRRHPDAVPVRLARLSTVGLILWVLTVTFAGIDWVGSLAATWYSTIFGLYILIGQALTALALVALFVTALPDSADHAAPTADALHDIGNLMLMLVILHAYMGFSQFFIIWNGNKPGETSWYLPRLHGVWGGLAITLVIAHFFLPFAALLFRGVKRNPRRLRAIAVLVLFARTVDAAWMVMPAYHHWSAAAAVLSVAALVGVGGLWLAAFLWQWRRHMAADLPAGATA